MNSRRSWFDKLTTNGALQMTRVQRGQLSAIIDKLTTNGALQMTVRPEPRRRADGHFAGHSKSRQLFDR